MKVLQHVTYDTVFCL